jgi:hypothetical protein
MATLDTTKVKWVRYLAPGGVVLNFEGQAGLSSPKVLSTNMIKRLLDQKVIVEEINADETTTLLTEDNYNTDNGGLPVEDTVQVTDDIEATHSSIRDARQAARIAKISEEFKKRFSGEEEEETESKEISSLAISKSSATINVGQNISVAGMPTKVTATLDDGSNVELDLNWDMTDVDTTEEDIFEIKGTPVLTTDITNPGGKSVIFTLTVVAA